MTASAIIQFCIVWNKYFLCIRPPAQQLGLCSLSLVIEDTVSNVFLFTPPLCSWVEGASLASLLCTGDQAEEHCCIEPAWLWKPLHVSVPSLLYLPRFFYIFLGACRGVPCIWGRDNLEIATFSFCSHSLSFFCLVDNCWAASWSFQQTWWLWGFLPDWC